MEIDATEVDVRASTSRLIQAHKDGAHLLVRYLLMQDLATALASAGAVDQSILILNHAEELRDFHHELEDARYRALSWRGRRRYRKDKRPTTYQADAAWYRAMA